MYIILKILEVIFGVSVFALGLPIAFGFLYWFIKLIIALPGLIIDSIRRVFNKNY